MRQRNSYSRIIQDPAAWHAFSKGTKIKLFQHCVEKDITSFFINGSRHYDHNLGAAFSESGLSRDEIQFIAAVAGFDEEEAVVAETNKILEHLDTDYLDLLLLDFRLPSDLLLSVIQRLRARGKIVEIGILEEKPGAESQFLKEFPASATLSGFKFSPAAIKTLTLAKAGPAETTQMLLLEDTDWKNDDEEVSRLAAKYDLQPKELLISWLLHHEGHFHPVIKADSEVEIDSVVKAFHTKLIGEDYEKFPERL